MRRAMATSGRSSRYIPPTQKKSEPSDDARLAYLPGVSRKPYFAAFFREALRALRAPLRTVLFALRATLRPALFALRAPLRTALFALRATLRTTRFTLRTLRRT